MGDSSDIFSEILEQAPSEHTVAVVLTRMKDQGRFREVMQLCTRFLKEYPHNLHLRSLMVESCLKKGFIGRALDEMEKLSSLINGLVLPYKSVAEYLAEQGKWAEAVPPLVYYLSHHPEDSEALGLLKKMETRVPSGDEEALPADFATPTIAELYYEQGQLEAAITTYEMILKKDPDNSGIMRRLKTLRDLSSREPGSHSPSKTPQYISNKRLMKILEGWLPGVREIKYAG